ncbi:MAG: WG repeat-containing protein [Ignavibacteriaceae bacterium]
MKRQFLVLSAMLLLFSISSFPQKTIIFDEVGEFNEGLAPVKKDHLWGFIDTKGNVVIQPQFSERMLYTPVFIDTLCLVVDPKTGKTGYINKTGQLVIPFQFTSASNFNNGYAFNYEPGSAANSKIQARCRLINTEGKVIVETTPNDYGYRTEFHEGKARFKRGMKRSNNRFEIYYGFLDTLGNIAIEDKFNDVRDFSDSLAAVQLGEKWGFIDNHGNIKIDCQFTNEPQPFSNGRARIQSRDNKYGYIDTSGNVVVEPIYSDAFPYSDGFTTVSFLDERYQKAFFIIDLKGKRIKEFKRIKKDNEIITFHSGFNDGLAVAQQGYGMDMGFIDTKGKTVIDFKFNKLKPFNSGLAYAEQYDKKTSKVSKGFIDKKGKFVILIEQPKF